METLAFIGAGTLLHQLGWRKRGNPVAIVCRMVELGVMTEIQLSAALERIATEPDPSLQAILTAAVVSEVFRDAGFEPVVVGGSAIEVYTEGEYRSGDVDICFEGTPRPTIDERAALMKGTLRAMGSMRTWKVGMQFVDLLGELETLSRSQLRSLETPAGKVLLMPIEELIAERVFLARGWHVRNEEAESCAKTLIRCALSGDWAVDWAEVERVAALPAYDCLAPLRELRSEMERTENLN